MSNTISFKEFKSKIQDLEAWDPKTQLIKKNLDLVAKPKNLSFCKRFALWFTHARSKEALVAIKTLQELTQVYEKKLKADQKTLKSLKNASFKVQKYLTTENKKINYIRSSSRRKKIDNICLSIQMKCIKLTINPVKKNSSIPYKPLKIKNVPQLLKFIRQFKPKSNEEAAFYFNEIHKFLNVGLSKHQANEILIKTKKIKSELIAKNGTSQELTEAHFKIRCQIRKRFFHDRLKKNKADLAAVEKNFGKLKRQNSQVQEIINEWSESLEKNKPIDFPKWFHCTKAMHINSILKSGKILVMAVAFKGAFAATIPETVYGSFCIALGSNIEENAKPPLITNVSNWNDAPIYAGEAPLKDTNDSTEFPSIWAGYKESILLNRPDKRKDPIGYYAHTNFCMLANVGDNPTEPDEVLEDSVVEDLAARKIKVLNNDDFTALTKLMAKTFHCQVPNSWENAPMISGGWRRKKFKTHGAVILED